ncbi:MAG: tetratricopeptide repeat protein [Acidobacteria bacterium]|nr:tetratricopeptide repeat protein [Acidobacteriota bacterium]
MNEHPRHWRLAGIGLFVILSSLTVVVYRPALDTPFLYDDTYLILENQGIRDPANVSYFVTYNRPLVAVSYAMDFALHGLDPRGYRLLQLLLHLLNGGLLALLAQRLYIFFHDPKASSPAWLPVIAALGAGLFLLHPVHSLTVILVSARSGMMCTFFYLAGLLLFIRWMEREFRGRLWLAVAGLYLAAGLCKEIAVTFPVMAALMLFYVRRKSAVAGWLRPSLKLFGLLALITGGLVLHAIGFQYGPSVGEGVLPFTRWEYALTQAQVVVSYLVMIIVPFPGWLSIDHDIAVIRTPLDPLFLAAGLTMLAVFVGGYFLWRRRRIGTLFGLVFFFVALAPTSSLMPIADLMMDYRLYLPSAGFVLAVVFVLGRCREGIDLSSFRRKYGPFVLAVCVAGYLTLLGVWLHERVTVFESPVSVWEDAVQKAPGKVRPRYNLSYAYSRQNRLAEAQAQIERALELEPRSTILHVAAGDILREQGRYDAAIAAYRRALDLEPDALPVLCRVTYLLVQKGELALAAQNLERIPRRGSGKECRLTVAIYLVETGQLEKALVMYRQVVADYPVEKSAWLNMGNILLRRGGADEAETCYRTALSIDPLYARAELALGLLYRQQGRMADAWQHLQAASHKNPYLAEADYERANWLATTRRYEEAEQVYETYVQKRTDRAEAWYRLALVRQEVGKTAAAAEALRRALELEPDDPSYLELWQRVTVLPAE